MNWHTPMVWVATCKSFLSQHFIWKNSLELNSYSKKVLNLKEQIRELEGMLPIRRKKLQAEKADNLQSMKGPLNRFFKTHCIKKKGKFVSWLACKIREVLCHEKIQQKLLQKHSRSWRKTGLQIFHNPEYMDFMLQHIKLPFSSSTALSSPNLGCR